MNLESIDSEVAEKREKQIPKRVGKCEGYSLDALQVNGLVSV